MMPYVQPPQPFCGRVTSTIQFGARKGLAEAMKVVQSKRERGEKIFVPRGQLPFCEDRWTSWQLEHFTIAPLEYGPFSATRLHLHCLGLPVRGFVSISFTPLHSTDGLPLANVGNGWNSALL
jgi:hypothetical protein